MRTIAAILVAATLCPCARSQGGANWSVLRPPAYLLVTNPAAQADLKLTGAQKRQVARVFAETEESLRGYEGLGDDEKQRRVAAALRRSEASLLVALSADQYRRIGEIELQLSGLRGILRAQVVGRLNLTWEQHLSVRELEAETTDWYHRKAAQLGLARRDPEQRDIRVFLAKDLLLAHAGREVKLLGILREEQKKLWRELLGRPFNVAEFLGLAQYPQ